MEYKHYFNDSDPDNSYHASCYGTVLLTVESGGRNRRVLLYMPKGRRECTAAVYIFPPDSWSCERAFENSDWKSIADSDEHKEKLALFFLEPYQAGDWDLDKEYGDPGDVCAYLEAVMKMTDKREYIHIDPSRCYAVGYGRGGTAAQMAALGIPARLAGLVSVGADPVPREYIESAGTAVCSKLFEYLSPRADKGFINRDIPLPVWLIDDPEYCSEDCADSLEYWREACGADAIPVKAAPDTDAYLRSLPPPHPVNQEKEAYRVWHSTVPGIVSNMGLDYNRRIWKSFLYRVRRFGGDPEGDLRIHRDPVEDAGADYHYQRIDGWMREWYAYIPQKIKEEPDKKAPLVLAIHGYGCSGDYYFNATQWFKVAEERNFILVCPSGVNGGKYSVPLSGAKILMAPSWNQVANPSQPNEVSFFRSLVEITAAEHNIDRGRVYASGHSNGSTTTHLLGLALSETFTAIAPVGGAIPSFFRCILDFPEVKNRPDLQVAAWIFIGRDEYELMPPVPLEGNDTANTIVLWRNTDGFEPAAPSDWNEGWVRHNNYFDLKYTLNGAPLVRYSIVEDMPHAVTPEMSFRAWDEFFCKFSRAEDGSLIYNG